MGSRRGRERKWGGGNRRQNEEVGQVGGKNETKEIVGSECFDKKQINSEKMQPTLSVHCTHTHTHTHTHMHTHTRMHTHTHTPCLPLNPGRLAHTTHQTLTCDVNSWRHDTTVGAAHSPHHHSLQSMNTHITIGLCRTV